MSNIIILPTRVESKLRYDSLKESQRGKRNKSVFERYSLALCPVICRTDVLCIGVYGLAYHRGFMQFWRRARFFV